MPSRSATSWRASRPVLPSQAARRRLPSRPPAAPAPKAPPRRRLQPKEASAKKSPGLKAGRFFFDLQKPLVMGVVNVTPDSFSDGGRFLEKNSAIRHAEALVRDGADIIDVGGESSRPGALPLSVQEELDRVLPVLEGLRA